MMKSILGYNGADTKSSLRGRSKYMLIKKYTIITGLLIISLLCVSSVNAGGIDPAENKAKPKLANTKIILKIGTVTIAISSSRIIIGNKLKKINIWYGDNNFKRCAEYYYIINDPFTPIEFYDGFPLGFPGKYPLAFPEKYPRPYSPQQPVNLFPKYYLKKVTESDFRKFSFFSSQRTTIGFMEGLAGASGGGSQTMYLFDTASDKYAIISFNDGICPTWIRYSSDKAPIYITKDASYIGCHSMSVGYGERISGVYIFKNSSYRRSPELEKSLFLQLYKESLLTPEEITYYKQATMQNIYNDPSKSPARLLDYMYYAKKAGKSNELTKFFNAMDKSLQAELSSFKP